MDEVEVAVDARRGVVKNISLCKCNKNKIVITSVLINYVYQTLYIHITYNIKNFTWSAKVC